MEAPYALHEFEGYKLGKTIGKGSMGKVKIATNQEGVQYACKIIKRSQQDITKDYLHKYQFMKDLETKELDDIRTIREMAINLLFDHPYIVTIHKVFVTNYHFYIIMDLVNGTQVLDFIISHGKLKEKFAMNLFAQLISAVEYCHLNSIVHRDLKIENILIDSKGFMQLIDFGLANLYSNHSYLNTFCGSLYFAAPELLSGRKYIGPEVDIWSLVSGN
jgi:serine/threonine protein kinase